MDDYNTIHIVTGAPGSGKSTSLLAFLDVESQFIGLDMDWLIQSASLLAGEDLHIAQSKWQSYNTLWFDVLHSICKNHRSAVLFAPLAPTDVSDIVLPWYSEIRWLLLDCPDDILRKRLEAREGWTDKGILEALADASHLRNEITEHVVDTNASSPTTVACVISKWLLHFGRKK